MALWDDIEDRVPIEDPNNPSNLKHVLMYKNMYLCPSSSLLYFDLNLNQVVFDKYILCIY